MWTVSTLLKNCFNTRKESNAGAGEEVNYEKRQYQQSGELLTLQTQKKAVGRRPEKTAVVEGGQARKEARPEELKERAAAMPSYTGAVEE